jgi:hypothetical protein
MSKLKQGWANFKSSPHAFQIAWWMVIGGGVVVALQECSL